MFLWWFWSVWSTFQWKVIKQKHFHPYFMKRKVRCSHCNPPACTYLRGYFLSQFVCGRWYVKMTWKYLYYNCQGPLLTMKSSSCKTVATVMAPMLQHIGCLDELHSNWTQKLLALGQCNFYSTASASSYLALVTMDTPGHVYHKSSSSHAGTVATNELRYGVVFANKASLCHPVKAHASLNVYL